MKADLRFSMSLPYMITEYEALKKLAVGLISTSEGYEWTFKVKDVEKVVKVLGKKVVFDEQDAKTIKEYSPLVSQTVYQGAYKGAGKFEVVYRSPKLFIIETIINKKVVKKEVPVENIEVAWKVMKRYGFKRKIRSRTVAENIVGELGITRFNRLESKSFDWEKFFGCRSDYFKYFYAPIKVLEAEGVIIHYKDGKVERITDNFSLQTQIVEEER